MLYNFQRKKLCRHLLVGGVLCAAGMGVFSCTDTYDLDTEQPSNYNSIYGYLEDDGSFTYYLRLIDDLSTSSTELSQKEILSKTGSRTLFVADDEAFENFFQSNDWGVSSYEELTNTQKKLLLYSSMISNPYTISMLATAEGPVTGQVCRRTTTLDIYDSVQVVSTTDPELPDNPFWTVLQSSHSEVVLFKDGSSSNPMIHFTPAFVEGNKWESTDLDFLYNQAQGTRQSDDAYVNDAKIVSQNIVCKNGFIHQVDKVITPLDNMAEIIRKHSNMSIYNSILERFAVPVYDASLTSNYNTTKGTSVDSVFCKRFFSARSYGSTSTEDEPLSQDKDGTAFSGSLKYDPGWNTYVSNEYNDRNAMMEDMAVMLVPTNEAMEEWWNNGSGQVIRDYYGSMDSVPVTTFDDLINNGMLQSLIGSVPSSFDNITNDASETMGVTLADIDSVFMGCNGVVYLTNKVFAPTAYSSVMFPTVIYEETMNVINCAIEQLEYDAYLNSMVSTYSFFIPTNDGLLNYIDPVSYGQSTTTIWEFHYDATKTQATAIYADVYECQLNEDGTWEKVGNRLRQVTGGTGNAQIEDRMLDILDNIIVIGAVTEGENYYITKGNNYVKVGGTINVAGAMTVSGSWQVERDQPITVDEVYAMDNGYAYVIDGVLMGTRKSVCDVLADHSDFSEFLDMLQESGMVTVTDSKDGWSAASRTYGNLLYLYTSGSSTYANYLLNSYHYTIYAPTNDAMQKAYAMGLPDLDDLAAAEALDEANEEQNEANANNDDWVELSTDSADHIRSVWRDFLKYHIQTNALFVDGGFDSGTYSTAKTKLDLNDDGTYSAGIQYKLDVSVSSTGITVTDNVGNVANVDTNQCNYMAREWWMNSSTIENATQIDNSSFAVIHAIDNPLVYDTTQFVYIEREISSSDD